MSDTLIFYVGLAVFILMMIGIGLTIYAFHRAGSEAVPSPKAPPRRNRPRQ